MDCKNCFLEHNSIEECAFSSCPFAENSKENDKELDAAIDNLSQLAHDDGTIIIKRI